MAAKAMGVARPIANNPRDITEKDCLAIYEEVF
jgi:alcohol dehydrogenase class IV